jgi:hypothetical protein
MERTLARLIAPNQTRRSASPPVVATTRAGIHAQPTVTTDHRRIGDVPAATELGSTARRCE